MPEPWIYPDWKVPAGVHAATTTRFGPGMSLAPYERLNLGLRSGDEARVVQGNREALQQALGLPGAPRWLHQVHGSAVAEVDALPSTLEPEADAALTRLPGTVLAILTADCLPVLLCADDGREIAAAHAGWRGLAAGVLEATVSQMHAPPQRIQAWLGPCIGAASYEVGAQVRDAFLARDPQTQPGFEAGRAGHWQCNLAWLARKRLQDAGVQRVSGGDFDTFVDARFYSYRRDGERSGRFASLVWTSVIVTDGR